MWKPRTYYVVEVQFSPTNVAHRAILYTGFLDKLGTPGSHSTIFNPTYDYGMMSVASATMIRVICEIPEMNK